MCGTHPPFCQSKSCHLRPCPTGRLRHSLNTNHNAAVYQSRIDTIRALLCMNGGRWRSNVGFLQYVPCWILLWILQYVLSEIVGRFVQTSPFRGIVLWFYQHILQDLLNFCLRFKRIRLIQLPETTCHSHRESFQLIGVSVASIVTRCCAM